MLSHVKPPALRPKGQSLLRVDPERTFIPALKSRAWAQSKGQAAISYSS